MLELLLVLPLHGFGKIHKQDCKSWKRAHVVGVGDVCVMACP